MITGAQTELDGYAVQDHEWRVAGLSLQGMGHRRCGLSCQDHSGWFATRQSLVVAVADGAGSALLGGLGSWLAVQTAVVSLLNQHLTNAGLAEPAGAEQALRAVVEAAAEALGAQAVRLGVRPSDLATTLILVIACPDFVSAAHVGDGAVVVSDKQLNLSTLTAPDTQEYVNEPVFLCSGDLAAKGKYMTRLMRPAHLAIFTDGLQMLSLKMPAASPHQEFFVPLFSHSSVMAEPEASQAIERFLESEQVSNRTEDDLTLVVAHLAPKDL